jgi:D-amino-acid dehydrogenase
VNFFFGETITNSIHDGVSVTGVTTDKADHLADKVVVCLGNESHNFLKPFDLSLKIYPIQGYSLTLEAKESSPQVSITDLKNKMVYAHLGDVFRIAGFVDTNQRVENIDGRIHCLLDKAQRNWPDVADFNGPIDRWTGSRPMTPSGVPVIGKTNVKGLYLNVGHGSLGYTFAAGSAMKIANEIGHARKNSVPVGGKFNAT